MTALVDRVLEVAEQQEAKKITSITINCGELSGVIPESLSFCFDVCVANSKAQDAQLILESVPAAWRCQACHKTFYKTEDTAIPLCPFCKSDQILIESGMDCILDSIEVE